MNEDIIDIINICLIGNLILLIIMYFINKDVLELVYLF